MGIGLFEYLVTYGLSSPSHSYFSQSAPCVVATEHLFIFLIVSKSHPDWIAARMQAVEKSRVRAMVDIKSAIQKLSG